MYEQTLPNYTAERYYLISEIEQKAVIYSSEFSNENDAKHNETLILTILYVLWNAAEDSNAETTIDKISTMLDFSKEHNYTSSNTLVVIDALIGNQEVWNQEMKSKIEILLNRLHWLPGVTCVVIGVTDNLGAMPGMEKCQELIEAIHPGFLDYPRDICFITYTQTEMLGHDPKLEPDAKSGVFQVLCWLYTDEDKQLLDKIQSSSVKPLPNLIQPDYMMSMPYPYLLSVMALLVAIAALIVYNKM
jgi:hypothetical protein